MNKLSEENVKFAENNKKLEEQNAQFEKSNKELGEKINQLNEQAEKFKSIYAKLVAENEKLARIRDGLQEQLNVSLFIKFIVNT